MTMMIPSSSTVVDVHTDARRSMMPMMMMMMMISFVVDRRRCPHRRETVDIVDTVEMLVVPTRILRSFAVRRRPRLPACIHTWIHHVSSSITTPVGRRAVPGVRRLG